MFFETYRGTIHWMSQMSFCRNLTFKACNTDPYVSLTLLHAVVRWKGLVDRVRVPCVMCPLPPGVVHGTKLGDVLCWDFALLMVLGFWLTGAKPDYPFIMGIPVHGRVRRRRNVWWFGVVYRKKEVTTWETHRGITRWQHSFRKNAKNLQSGKPSREYWVTIFFSKNVRLWNHSRHRIATGWEIQKEWNCYWIRKCSVHTWKNPQHMGNKIGSSGDSDREIYTAH